MLCADGMLICLSILTARPTAPGTPGGERGRVGWALSNTQLRSLALFMFYVLPFLIQGSIRPLAIFSLQSAYLSVAGVVAKGAGA